MKAQFFEYHTPSKTEFETLWRSAVYSFDASVLLDLYRFSNESREELLKLLRLRRDRLWLTHQSAYEFHKNRLQVIGEAGKRAAELKSALVSLKTSVRDEYKQHPYVASGLCERIIAFSDEVLKDLEKAESDYPNLLSEDPIAREVLDIFDDRVGSPYDPDKLAIIEEQIAVRYDNSVPPGYRDRKTKDERRSYGDCIAWFQLIDYSKVKKCPIILVTRDLKEDWWLRESGKTLMPRPELRREFRDSTGGYDFYLYQTPTFIEHAKEFKSNSISDRLLEESRVIATESQARRNEQSITADGGVIGFAQRPPTRELRFTGDINPTQINEVLKALKKIMEGQTAVPRHDGGIVAENIESAVPERDDSTNAADGSNTGDGNLRNDKS